MAAAVSRPAHRKVRSVVLQLRPGERVLGLPADPRRARGTGHHGGAVHGLGILKNAGIDPAPRRDGPGWAEFLRSQAQGILALDFFTADLLNGAKVHVLAVIEHGTRRVRILGAAGHLSRRGSCSRPGTCTWTWRTPGHG